MSNLIGFKNASEEPVKVNNITLEQRVMNYKNADLDDNINYFGLGNLKESDFLENYENINDIIKGNNTIDFIGCDNPYSNLFKIIAKDRKVNLNIIDNNIDPTLIESKMLTDTLVVGDMPPLLIEGIINNLSGKKNVIIGNLYIKELSEDSKSKR